MGHQPTVLIIDDHADSLRLSRIILDRLGFRVHEAANGLDGLRQALNLSARNNLRAIVLDINMPLMDGLTTAQVLRGQSELRDVVVIALTANVMSSVEQRALQAGFDYYFSKPITSRFAMNVRDCIQQGRVPPVETGLSAIDPPGRRGRLLIR